jgi:hypothetical protein
MAEDTRMAVIAQLYRVTIANAKYQSERCFVLALLPSVMVKLALHDLCSIQAHSTATSIAQLASSGRRRPTRVSQMQHT